MVVRNGEYEWHGYRSRCKECSLTDSKADAYIRRIKAISHIPPYESPSELEIRAYKERIATVGELPPFYSEAERREQKNARGKAQWWANRQAHIARKRAYNAREEVRGRNHEYGAQYRATTHGRAVHNDAEARRRARIAGGEHLAWFYDAVRRLPLVRCHICGGWLPGPECHIDHVVPLAKNGPHSRNNLATSCPSCNMHKHARLDWEPTPARL